MLELNKIYIDAYRLYLICISVLSMNISELARKIKVNTEELREKLPELGFDIGAKAIKINDQLAGKIIRSWRESQERAKQKEKYEKITNKDEKGNVVLDKKIEIPSVLTVKDFSELLDLPVTIIIQELMKNGVMATMNQRIDFDTAAIVAAELGFDASEIDADEKVEIDKAKKIKQKMAASDQSEMQNRPPVVVVMGHVDHGKTKTLDAIRKTDVVSGEAGGITQHIGAYQVTKNNKKITFIDTPGHEAFTAMRSRGAKVADIIVLVVAANEGVKPQTVEALKIAQESGVSIIVAVNKIDLPDANPEKVKQELSQYNLLPEAWGGKTLFVEIAAKTGENIDGLLEAIVLTAEMEEDKIKANSNGEFFGSIIESNVDKAVGPVATVLVKNGTLTVGQYVVVDGTFYGKIRSMYDYKNNKLTKVGPSMPARIYGLKVAPKVGDVLEVVENPKQAKKVSKYYMSKHEETFINTVQKDDSDDENAAGKLNIILRCDVLGSQEAIVESLNKIETEDFKVKIVSKGLGNVTESDVLNAEATDALIIGFNVVPSQQAFSLAQEKEVEIKQYKIIYEVIDEVKKRSKDIIKTELVREDVGKLEVLALFKKGDTWQVIGGKVKEGKVEAGANITVLRENEFITSGKIVVLQSGKEDVKEVDKGQECGIKFEGQPLIEEGDVLDVYWEREVKKTL